MAQEVEPYAKHEIKVDWVRGTGFLFANFRPRLAIEAQP
jgi:hypothetical protein